MVKKVLGVVFLVWGVVMAFPLYQSATEGGEGITGVVIAISATIVVIWIGLGIWLLWPREKLRPGAYTMNFRNRRR